MCSGGRLLADFTAGTDEAPALPDVVRACLTETADGRWVVWAQKLARVAPDGYEPLTGGPAYPADAEAYCRARGGHAAPQPDCTCGFHAVSTSLRSGTGVQGWLSMISPGGARRALTLRLPPGLTRLDVVLSGRVLAFDLFGNGVLFRAARQTVVRIPQEAPNRDPDDPSGVLAHLVGGLPKGAGPRRLRLPSGAPPAALVSDDAGFCMPLRVPEERVPVLC